MYGHQGVARDQEAAAGQDVCAMATRVPRCVYEGGSAGQVERPGRREGLRGFATGMWVVPSGTQAWTAQESTPGAIAWAVGVDEGAGVDT